MLGTHNSDESDPFLEIVLDRFDGSLSHINIDTNSINVDYSALGIVKRAPITDGLGDQLVSDDNIGGIKKVTSQLVNKSITFVIQHPVKTTFIIIFVGIGSFYVYTNRTEIMSSFKRRKDQLRAFFHKFKR